MVVAGGTDLASRMTDSDLAMHMVIVLHTEADTGWLVIVQADMMLVLVQPESAHHYSLSKYRPYFPSRVGMLSNPSLHVLLT